MYVFRLFEKDDAVNPVDARMLRDGVMRIGRDPASDWVIADPDCEISRAHCELHAGPDGLTLRALGANGVYDADTQTRFADQADVPLAIPRAIRFGRYRMVAEHAPDAMLDPSAAGRTMVLTPPLGTSVEVPSDWDDPVTHIAIGEEGSLLEAFCEGAGLDVSAFSTDSPEEIMRRAGAVYRQMVLGVGDLMSERDCARAQYRLALTTIGGHDNNPFKWAPTQRLAIDLLMAGESSFLSGPAALQASFSDVKRHLVATFAGFKASIETAVASFDPVAVEKAVGNKGSLLKGKAALAWEEASERHADLARQLNGSEDGSLNQAFVEAYGETVSRLSRDTK